MNMFSYWATRVISLLIIAIVVSACTTVKGSWYFQERGELATLNCNEKLDGCLLLALNNDSNRPLTVKRIDVYATKKPLFGFSHSDAPIWRCYGPWRFDSSMIIVVNLPRTINSACRIPIDATLTSDSYKRVRINLNSSMPSAIPDSWLDCPNVKAEGNSSVEHDCTESDDSNNVAINNRCLVCEAK